MLLTTCHPLPVTSGILATSGSHGLAMSLDALLRSELLSAYLAPSISHGVVCLVFITCYSLLAAYPCYLKWP